MDKNKDKRNFLDEEKEIEKLLSEFESENIKIPDELDERLNTKLKENPDKLPPLKNKEKDFLEYTIRLDLSELQKNINKKINRGE